METIRDRLWKKAGEQGIPLTAAFELLPLCNLSCRMCYVRKGMEEVAAGGGLMDGDQWLALAEEACREGLLFPLLTGGEPLLHPDFRGIFLGMTDLGMQVSVNTNGTLIDRETAAWFGKHPPVRVNLTLYGASEKSYQDLCGNGAAFEKVCHALDLLKEYSVPVKLNTSITPQNVEDLENIMAFAKARNLPIQVATYMFPPIRRNGDMVGRNDRLSPEAAALARVKADFLQGEPDWFRGQAMRFRAFVEPTEAVMRQIEGEGMAMSCRAGHCSFWIDWQGNLINCGMYGSVAVPLKGRPFQAAWLELREQTHRVRYAPKCAQCPNQKLCHPCIAMVHNECGDVNGWPEYLCRMNAASARYYQAYAEKLGPAEGEPPAPPPDRDCEFETDGF